MRTDWASRTYDDLDRALLIIYLYWHARWLQLRLHLPGDAGDSLPPETRREQRRPGLRR